MKLLTIYRNSKYFYYSNKTFLLPFFCIFRKYGKIVNNEQRAQYKKDFYIEYEEYRRLHRYIENVATKFSELEIRLNTKVEGSDDWNVSQRNYLKLFLIFNQMNYL
jgi:hypothetical protein